MALALSLFALAACAAHTVERRLVTPDQAATLDGKSPFLKAHLRSGYVYVLSSWSWSDSTSRLSATGKLFDADRKEVRSGTFVLPGDSVALFETNVTKLSKGTAALAVMTGITAGVAIACATNPKACFGSCPTFYVPDTTGEPLLQAEGFSASIAPGLEAVDVDALYRARLTSRDFTIRLSNEALETHVLRYVDVLAAPRPPHGRVFSGVDGSFYAATEIAAPDSCRAAEGDCRPALASFDARERSVTSDSSNLAARETIDLEFQSPPAGPQGLVIAARQSLMTTFLIYQALAYMGNDATRWLASIPVRGKQPSTTAEDLMAKLLGKIDVLVPDSAGQWRIVGQTGETGPIATDTKIIPLPAGTRGPLHVRLQLTKGLWRLDWVSLAALGSPVVPERIRPIGVRVDSGVRPDVRERFVSRSEALVTLPGDEYFLDYHLPADPSTLELFIETRGYYLEWMRREWIADQNAAAVRRLLLDPGGMLMALAPAYKKQEAAMEAAFWASRYAKH